ncbi:MAG: carbon-nitrogen hydrolase family protein [Firmicutes bacterium]|nr:carbon-nitrogen hydrolase family protein [Bacillota bacterium]
MRDKFKLAVCQLTVVDDKTVNLKQARAMIKAAAQTGGQVVVLPEMFNCPHENKSFPVYAETFPNGETIQMLKEAAREEKIYLIGGSIPERDRERLYNTSFVFSPSGELLGRHRKIHLFDVQLASGLSFRESDTLAPGNTLTVVETEYCPIGVVICYDLRFPELLRLMALLGAQVIVVPAAFNMTTGPAHWEVLLRMRAVDNQVYVVGASPARNEAASYVAYGHSLVVEPWGRVIASADEKEQIILAEIDLEHLHRVREELPLLKHRRTDLYQLSLTF